MLITRYSAVTVILTGNQDGTKGNLTRKLIKVPVSKTKTPSQVAYQSDNLSFSMSSSYWGLEIDPSMKAYSWNKLLLDTNASLSEFDDEVLRNKVSLGILVPRSNKAAVDVVSDYLHHVLSFMMCFLRNELDDLLDRLPIDIQFAVPSTWSEESLQLSKQAVSQAWTNKKPQDLLILVSEPEASIESALELLQLQSKNGDGILVCDCGGRTVVCLSFFMLITTYNMVGLI